MVGRCLIGQRRAVRRVGVDRGVELRDERAGQSAADGPAIYASIGQDVEPIVTTVGKPLFVLTTPVCIGSPVPSNP